MARSKPPCIDFYPDDFMGGTAGLHPLAVGLYIRCLCVIFSGGTLPVCPTRLMRITQASAEDFEKFWPEVSDRFERSTTEKGSPCLVNRRALDEFDKKCRIRRARSKAGTVSASQKYGPSRRPALSIAPMDGGDTIAFPRPHVMASTIDFSLVVFPPKFDTLEVRVALEAWLSFLAKSGKPAMDASLTANSALQAWKHVGPETFVQMIYGCISNGWVNLREIRDTSAARNGNGPSAAPVRDIVYGDEDIC